MRPRVIVEVTNSRVLIIGARNSVEKVTSDDHVVLFTAGNYDGLPCGRWVFELPEAAAERLVGAKPIPWKMLLGDWFIFPEVPGCPVPSAAAVLLPNDDILPNPDFQPNEEEEEEELGCL